MLLFLVPIGTTNICREVLRLLDPCLHLYICINIQMEAQVQSFQNHKTSLLILIVQIGTKKNSALFMFFFHLDCVHITFFVSITIISRHHNYSNLHDISDFLFFPDFMILPPIIIIVIYLQIFEYFQTFGLIKFGSHSW